MFYLPCDLLISAIYVYIFIPIISLKSGIIIPLTEENDGKRKILQNIEAKDIPIEKLFENLGEAVPQAIMCLVFIANNFQFILHEETSNWMPIPLSVMSLIFSVGSVAMGLFTGIKPHIKAKEDWGNDDAL